MQKSDIERIEAFEMWIWRRTVPGRRMLEVSWTEHKKNDEVLRTAETRRELMDTLRTDKRGGWDMCYIMVQMYFGENSVGRATTREEGKRKTERNATELATADK